MNEELNKDAIKAIRERYGCVDEIPCEYLGCCRFCGGSNISYDCGKCCADEFYAGYIHAIEDNEKE